MFQEPQKRTSWKDIEDKVNKRMSRIVEQTYDDCKPAFLIFAFQRVLTACLELTIFFRNDVASIWKGFNIQWATSILQAMNPATYMVAPEQMVICEAVIGSLILATVVLWIVIMSGMNKKVLLLVAVQLVRLLRLLAVPIYQILFFILTCKSPNCPTFLVIVNVILFIFVVLLNVLYTRYYYNPLQKDNIYNRYGSNYQTYEYLFMTLRFIMLLHEQISVSFLVITIAMCFYLQSTITGCCNTLTRSFTTYPSEIILVTSLAILSSLLLSNGDLLFYVWLLVLCGLFAKNILKAIFETSNHLSRFTDCRTVKEEDFLYFVEYARKLQGDISTNGFTNFASLHGQSCKEQGCCLISALAEINGQGSRISQGSAQEMEGMLCTFINSFLWRYSSDSQLYAIMLYVRLYQMGSQDKVKHFFRIIRRKDFLYSKSFIDQLMNSEENEECFHITEENFSESKQLFFRQLRQTVVNIGKFMTQLKEKQARLTILERYGKESYDSVFQLKKKFRQFIKNGRTDFKVIELYLEFALNFLMNKKHANQVAQKLKRKSRVHFVEYSDVSQSPKPTIQVLRKQKAKIKNLNSEALKFFGKHRIEMVDKDFFSFITPHLDDCQYFKMFESLLETNLLCFVNCSNGTKTPIRLNYKIHYSGNKKLHFLEFGVIRRLATDIYIIINDQNNMEEISIAEVEFGKISISTTLLYSKYIKEQLKSETLTKSIDIFEAEKELVMKYTVGPTIKVGYRYVFIEFQVKGQQKMIDTATIAIKPGEMSQISWRLGRKSGKLTYKGAVDSLILSKFSVSPQENKKIMEDQYEKQTRINYSLGIKTYRVIGQRMYNIQLEDQNGKPILSTKNIRQTKNPKQKNKSSFTIYIVLIGITLGFLPFIIVNIYQKLDIRKQLDITYFKLTQIQLFEMRFFRLIGILRDGRDGITYPNIPDWKSQLLRTFDQIQQTQKQLYFSTDFFTIQLEGKTYTSHLDELCNVLISKMYTMAKSGIIEGSQQIQYLGGTIVLRQISKEKDRHSASINNYLQILLMADVTLFAMLEVLTLATVGLILKLMHNQIKSKEIILSKYTNMSDMEIASCIERLDKFQIVINLSQKNEESEVFNVLCDQTQYLSRENPKKIAVKLSQYSKVHWWVVTLSLLSALVFYFVFSFTMTETSQMEDFVIVHTNLHQSYTDLLQIAIQHKVTKIEPSFLDAAKMCLITLENNRAKLSPGALSAYIEHFMFHSSCDLISEHLNNISCEAYAKGFAIKDPFSQGLSYYFHSLYQFVFEDYKQVTPVIGLLGEPFYRLFSYVVIESYHEWVQFNASSLTSLYGAFAFNIIQQLCLLCIVLYTITHDRKAIQETQNICTLISNEKDTTVEDEIEKQLSQSIILDADQLKRSDD